MNYKSKKIKSNKLKYIKNYKSKFIILSIIILFSFFIYLSIPVFYNYDTYDQELKNKINQDFKINVNIIKKIEYKILPRPHFLIQNSVINFNDTNNIAKIDNFKILLNLKNLHKIDDIQLKKIIINESNIKFKYSDLESLHLHLQKKIMKPIHIYNSNFFYYDEDEKNILISPIKKLKYFIDTKNKTKNLTTSGILFGSDYNFEWVKDYNQPNFSKSYIKFKDLNLNIDSQFTNSNKKNSFKSKMNIELLRKKISLNYFVNKNEIEFFNDEENLNNSNLIGKINLDPFFFNLNLNLSNLDIETFIQYFFLYLHSFENEFHDNLNGNIKFNIDKLSNKYFNNLKFNLNFKEGKINFENGVLKLNKIGKINLLNVKYINRENAIFLRLKIELTINDQNEFYRRFQISKNDRVKLVKIYSFVEKNIDKNEYFIEKIYFNNMPISNDKNKDISSNSIKVENFHALSKLIKDELKQINLD